MEEKIKVLDKGFVYLVDHMGDDTSIVQAARVSTGKGSKSAKKDRELIRYLMRFRHTSPFEQVEFKFHVKAPIFCFRQWHRHRTASLNEMSGRYRELPEECYIPEFSRLQTQDKTNHQGSGAEVLEECAWIQESMKKIQENSFSEYRSYLNDGLTREVARINLPLSTYSEMYWKMDLHNLFHFLGLRLHPHAQWEMRQFAKAIFELIKPIVPASCEAFEDYRLNTSTFSAKEMEVIRSLLNSGGGWKNEANRVGLNELEYKEFVDKLTG